MVGIAAPVIIRFSTVVADRVAAERGIAIDTPAEVPGEFTWIGDRVVQWTPQDFWPAYTPVTVRTGGMATSFDVGAAVMAVADISAHTFTVSMDGQTVREMPASLGKPGFDTPQGTFKVLEKQRRVKFDSRTIGIPLDSPEGYLIDGEYAVRVTWGGVYVHSAPWSVGSQGNANVSHGCINLSPDNAAWYFDTVSIGDPVIVEA
ncbi:L,D-transpeptidase [Mycobacterium sp. 29Ha]|uniref:L,D-transpeptidase n=1 Tax=Mycobacterium sp. 29Ha TaxID=2939268 RepID=UPI0029391562|nr:L,D-transpeptidase [Mycobacterium sp. 29Ha]